jgi:hypothetical protein
MFTRTSFKILSRSNLRNKVVWLLVLNFTGSPIHPPLGALKYTNISSEVLNTNSINTSSEVSTQVHKL